MTKKEYYIALPMQGFFKYYCNTTCDSITFRDATSSNAVSLIYAPRFSLHTCIARSSATLSEAGKLYSKEEFIFALCPGSTLIELSKHKSIPLAL